MPPVGKTSKVLLFGSPLPSRCCDQRGTWSKRSAELDVEKGAVFAGIGNGFRLNASDLVSQRKGDTGNHPVRTLRLSSLSTL